MLSSFKTKFLNNFTKPRLKKVSEIGDYLSGKDFDYGLAIDLGTENPKIEDREVVILNKIRGRSVIHVGCVDHVPLIDEKIKKNEWLHKLITDEAKKCVGIDNNSEGIEYIKKLGFDNVLHFDLTDHRKPEILNTDWDYMLLGEIIEHVDNPISFLKEINDIYRDNGPDPKFHTLALYN